MKIGILGGTFNPPHLGHLILAQEALEQLELEKVFFIPASTPPHKSSRSLKPKIRLKMVSLAIAGNSKFKVLDLEIKRKGVSYTVETLLELKKMYPRAKLYLIIGSDLAADIANWKNPDKIKEIANIAVAKRKGFPLLSRENFLFLDTSEVDISSSLVRIRAQAKKSIKYLVPGKVEKFIIKNSIYKR